MKFRLFKLKVVLLWMLATLLMAAQPVETQESLREVEETEEVKLYCENEEHSKQKPKPEADKPTTPLERTSADAVSIDVDTEKPPKYILYCNLIHYQ